jgi:hypothetical protein
MKVIISLDTEDYVSPNAIEAQKWWARTLSAHGIRASFQCVGELVREWLAKGRSDVIDAVARHEIGFHELPLTTSHPPRGSSKPLVRGGSRLGAEAGEFGSRDDPRDVRT